MKVDKICIVGGGTAGWMTAATLCKFHPELDITLIEAEDIPPIGVGESTTQFFKDWTFELGLADHWMDECEATYKYSVKFENFSEYGDFHYPFYDGGAPENSNSDILEWFFHDYVTGHKPDKSFAEWMVPYWRIIEENLVVPDDFPSFDYRANAGYHLDASKFATYLKREFCLPRGVKHIYDTITDVEKNEHGEISRLNMKYEADLFIDCTGFRSLLLGEHMGVEWEEFPFLINDRAWACRVKYQDRSKEMLNHTRCTALDNGWVWHVPLTSRLGVGYNFASSFISDEDALEELKAHLGDHEIIGEPRLITWRNGMAKEIWHKNVVGIGLSGGFIEPLESNGLLSVHNFAIFLADALSMHENRKVNSLIRSQYNFRCRKHFGNFAHFVGNHFFMTTKDDTPYWDYISSKCEYLDGMARHEHKPFPGDEFPLRTDEINNWKFDKLAGNSYIAAGHRHSPCTGWTTDYLERRNQLDVTSFKKLESGYDLHADIHREIDKFPTPEEFYYCDAIAGIDLPYYEHA